MKTSSYESILRELMPKGQTQPLVERRDYSNASLDAIEQNAVSLLEKGIKLPMMLELRLRKKYKKASIIDYPQSNLCPMIWDLSKAQPSVRPIVRDKILTDLFNVLTLNFKKSKEWVTDVSITGSMSTNQYDHETDVDINVSIDYDLFRKYNLDLTRTISNDLELRNFIRHKVYILNGNKLTSDHTIKYFVTGKGNRLESDAIYDLLNDKWLKEHQLVELSFEPDDEFAGPRSRALQIIMSIVPFILKTKIHISDMIRLENGHQDVSVIKDTVKSNIEDLKQIQLRIKEIRL